MTREDLRRFYALNIDFSPLGLDPWSEHDAPCFCTPETAECFASAGVDGVHYCLLPGEETVYVVRPMCCQEGLYVLPVAEDFREFLSFLLCCGHESALEQMPLWETREQFQAYLAQQETADPAALDAVAAAFGLEPENPYEKVKALQEAFDPSRLSFSDEYYETLGLENPRCAQAEAAGRGGDAGAFGAVAFRFEKE